MNFLYSYEDGIFLFSLCKASVGKIDIEAGSARNAVCARCSSVSSLSLSMNYHKERGPVYLISPRQTLLMNFSYRKAMLDPKILSPQKSTKYVYFQ